MYLRSLLLSILFCFYIIAFGDKSNKMKGKGKSHNVFKLPIKYYSNLTETNYVDNAMEHLSLHTCIIVEKLEAEFSGKGLIFTNGDYDDVIDNFKENIPSIVKLTSVCAQDMGCIDSLIAIALGVIPQHNRLDRDKYIKINEDNIHPNYTKSFDISKKHLIENLKTEFDFGSITNRNPKNTSKSINTTSYESIMNSLYDEMLGQKYDFSHNDEKILNELYCKKSCNKKIKKCHNGGFQDPLQCDVCRCSNGFSGKYCKDIEESDEGCGNTKLKAKMEEQTFNVSALKRCIYFIESKPGTKIDITVVNSSTIIVPMKCWEDLGIEIKNRHDKGTTGLSLCGNHQNVTLDGISNEVLIIYNGLDDTNYATFGYKAVKKGKSRYNYN